MKSEEEFYVAVADQIDFGVGYGYNLHAFYDRLGFDLERPIHIVWKNHIFSEKNFGSHFDFIVDVMEEIKERDEKFYPEGERFTYFLE